MNRQALWRLLQVAVVAPFLYKVSQREKGYFSVGLKMVAGSIIIMNIPELINDADTAKKQAKTFFANLQKAQEALAQQNAGRVVIDRESVTEATFSEN